MSETKYEDQKADRFKAIVQTLLIKPNLGEVIIKAKGGNTKISKVVLITLSSVFRKTFDDFDGSELELDYPLNIVQSIIDSMHNEFRFECEVFNVKDLFEILKFGVNYDIQYLVSDVTDYFKSKIESDYKMVNDVFHVYDHGSIGREIYWDAISSTITQRSYILRSSAPCCGTVYTHNTCCTTLNCIKDPTECCTHRSAEDRKSFLDNLKNDMDDYATMLKDVSIQVHQDIIKHELTRVPF